jgi:hypothetical protein
MQLNILVQNSKWVMVVAGGLVIGLRSLVLPITIDHVLNMQLACKQLT